MIENDRRIAIVGKMRSGKDTAANYLKNELKLVSSSFGEGITEVIENYFPEALKGGNKPRGHYQTIGQAFRHLNPDIWIDTWELRYLMHLNIGIGLLVTDVRQPNEYQRMRDMGFTIIKIEAGEEERIQRIQDSGDAFDMEQLNHETEQHVDGFGYDYLVDNNGTIEEFYQQLDDIIAEIKGDE